VLGARRSALGGQAWGLNDSFGGAQDTGPLAVVTDSLFFLNGTDCGVF